jgi:hypothetical protein
MENLPRGYSVYVDDDGNEFAYTLLGVKSPARGEKWDFCSVCGESLPASDLTKIRGALFGISCGDAGREARVITKSASSPRPGGRRP